MDSPDHPSADPQILVAVTSMRLPFGKYKGRLFCDLPVEYLEWFARKGFPPGKMGMLLSTVYEIKLNGLEYLLTPFKARSHKE
jgi:uncharacterized protein